MAELDDTKFTSADRMTANFVKTPFSRAKVGAFFQEEPRLGNQFTADVTLQKYLKRHLPKQVTILISIERPWLVALKAGSY